MSSFRVRIIVWLLFSIAFLLAFATSQSPFYDIEGCDQTVFKLVALKWLHGGVPYVDIFDHKGPYLFLINMLGMNIGGEKWGILMLEVINLTVVLELLYRIGQKMGGKGAWLYVWIFMFPMAMAMYFFDDLSEEWSLPPLLLSLYLAIKAQPHISNKGTLPPSYAFTYGFCFAFICLISVKNSYLIVGIVLASAIMMIVKRNWRQLCLSGLWALAGIIVCSGPIIIYFIVKKAWHEFMFANFYFNFNYVDSTEYMGLRVYASRMLWECLSATVWVLVAILCHRKLKLYQTVLYASSALLFLYSFVPSYNYLHYYVLLLPLTFTLQVWLNEEFRNLGIFLAILVACPPFISHPMMQFHEPKYSSVLPIQHMIEDNVPQTDRNDIAMVSSYMDNIVWVHMNMVPTSKYIRFFR